MKKITLLVCLALLLQNCALFRSPPKLPEKNIKVVVLPFTTRGPNVSNRTGYIAADKLTSFLFVKKKMRVVDRSLVNHTLNRKSIDNVYFLSQQELVEIADTLNASVVVLGLLENRTLQQDMFASQNIITVTLRFLAGDSGETLQIVYETQKTDLKPLLVLDEFLETMVDKL
ncbi:MAG: hypothetical protein GWO08_14850 [Gammaproteobacteria bacterium]|nr:hypothetical protein [candidate division Zixibacteria bacterium]NIR94889.1 hypothetical protein [Gammaproteobacteria bacterium]NIT59523.1 hypothetical protein [Fodinibius sp.]NIS47527.1 hypothetical protein [candidate division Zixibacteria bacterium]NIU15624.1 hypothetical protein [candidate division Zixibacteria bacterium]